METQLKAYYQSSQGIKFINIFGYATRGVPSLEINGLGKYSKNMKEKLIFLTRSRKLRIPVRRYVICLDIDQFSDDVRENLKCLEFPILLLYWYLCGLIPMHRLDECVTSGWVRACGDIYHTPVSKHQIKAFNNLKYIGSSKDLPLDFNLIESPLLLEHIPDLSFKEQKLEELNLF